MASNSERSNLLVSVRSPEEAWAALNGGAELIDVKEPSHGSLGRAPLRTILKVIRTIAGRCPVSAAMGELREARRRDSLFSPSLDFVKWGLAQCGGGFDWRSRLEHVGNQMSRRNVPAQIVIAAYVDWRPAQAPAVDEVVEFACRRPGTVLLLDTWSKTGNRTLLDWMSKEELAEVRRACRSASVRLAWAGSLGACEINQLKDLQPDWFAVRGAVCVEDRQSAVSAEKVRQLADLLGRSASLSTSGSLSPSP